MQKTLNKLFFGVIELLAAFLGAAILGGAVYFLASLPWFVQLYSVFSFIALFVGALFLRSGQFLSIVFYLRALLFICTVIGVVVNGYFQIAAFGILLVYAMSTTVALIKWKSVKNIR
jgi:hypothetical protein